VCNEQDTNFQVWLIWIHGTIKLSVCDDYSTDLDGVYELDIGGVCSGEDMICARK